MFACREVRRAPFIYLGRSPSPAGTLFREQSLFALYAPPIAAECATLSDDAMTRNDGGAPVARTRARNCAHGFRRTNGARDIGVGTSLAERNLLQLAPNFPL